MTTKDGSALDEYRERQIRSRSTKTYIARKLRTIAIFLAVTLIVDFAILGGSADKVGWQTALFWSGALWIGIGALMGGGFADTATVGRINPAASPTTAETLARDRIQERDKQLGSMLTMMITGGILWLLFLIVTYVV